VSTIAPPSLPTEAVVREKPALFAVPKAPPPGLVGFHAVRVLVLGDSIADTLGQGLEQDAGRWGAKVFDMGFIGCDLDPDSTVNNEGFIGPPPQGCKGWQQTWPKDVALFQADVVAIELGRWEVLDRVVDGHWTTIGQKPWDDLFTAELTRAIKEVSATGRKWCCSRRRSSTRPTSRRTANRGTPTCRAASRLTTTSSVASRRNSPELSR